ncbi:uncharacterized protein LOC125683681 isoform X2 [Ostrea edulis]|uniref:uncharacterized protein LOC125683681 isoform X2 n=1 Tax=Ostrea edulis TaxID=37623 RepID=UPI0020942B1D|nr:uncharacterized protein LOC125683681 isoform X2 [Ostrea edulis]
MTVMFRRSVLGLYKNHLFLCICGLFISGCRGKRSYSCYECNYLINSEGDYNCVTSPWNVTSGVGIRECVGNGKTCVTKTVYTKDRTRIYQMYRKCTVPDTFDCGIACCVEDSAHDYTCQSYCRNNLCNDSDESARLILSQAHQKPPGSRAANIIHKFIRMTVYVKRNYRFAPCMQ